ncbi:adenosylcobinamide-GDP ribazoletransferase [Synechocystis sp. PCC 7509]|uniref:adenosylcobinamide-GDP ribazoletransferase n=1 Tax=Synechocystis sp. PCC 7509 TaxID=927677 RepID=UPI00031A62CA|nr:adenosylcobinamide-GDP ribazoletransferase [Synechocystis sp. PCC 7509]
MQINQHCSWKQLSLEMMGAVTFYTCIPLPINNLEFRRVAYFAPLIGLMIGGILGLIDRGLHLIGMPLLTSSALVVGFWILLTGGLHLDGVMDAADGLAVQNPQKRLEVMVDSATGAFGAMAAIALLLLKTAALADLHSPHWLGLIVVCGWGRWGQQIAIAFYPYLKPTGKGKFHKDAITSYWDLLPGLILLLSVSAIAVLFDKTLLKLALFTVVGGSAIAFSTGAWFYHWLGGHTGDTYGAVVEWTEAFLLCLLTVG